MTDQREAAAPHDREAAAAMWAQYLAAHPEHSSDELVVDHFGDSATMADELIELVLVGQKCATAALEQVFLDEGEPLPRLGSHWVACDGAGRPRAVVRSVDLRLGPIDSVDDAFAWDEGEGDRTRDDWLSGHERYWRRAAAAAGTHWDPASTVVFERFRVVWPPEHADPAEGA
jgi:uncharacterized protein YhfF